MRNDCANVHKRSATIVYMKTDLITLDHLRYLESEEGFWDEMVTKGSDTECWEWGWGRTAAGYGYIDVRTPGTERSCVRMYAHRAAWGMHNGQVPPRGVEIDHLCHNPACCNPRHLEAVDRLLNNRRIRGTQKPTSRVSKSGKVTWMIRYYDYSTGKRRYLSRTFATEAEAVEAARTLREDRKRLGVTA